MNVVFYTASDYGRSLMTICCLAAIAASGSGLAFSQPIEFEALDTPDERFELAVKKIVGNWDAVSIGGGTNAPVKFVVMTCNEECTTADVLQVARWGHVERARISVGLLARGGRQGLTGRRLGDKELASIDDLVGKLPDEAAEMPPVERRILMGWAVDDSWKTRIYDRAFMPSQLNEILKAVVVDEDRPKFGAWTCRLTPDRERTVKESPGQSRFTIDPRGTALILAGGDRLRVFDIALQEQSAAPLPAAGDVVQCEFSREGRFLVILSGESSHHGGDRIDIFETTSWKGIAKIERSRAEEPYRSLAFAPRSKQLVVWTKDRPLTYDVPTWKASAQRVSEGEAWRQWSPDATSAFVVKEDESPWLWKESDQSLVCLDEKCKSLKAAFSPNSCRLAILTIADKEGVRLRVWHTDDASHCTELWPYGLSWSLKGGNDDAVMCWSPDSAYFISASNVDPFRSTRRLHLWNTRTGRHCADFIGTYTNLIGVGFAASGESLVAASPDRLSRWNFESAVKRMTDFETSLSAPR